MKTNNGNSEDQKVYGHGGARENAGRKGNCTQNLSARVPVEVVEKIHFAAVEDGISLSSKTCEILKNWARRN